MTEFNERDLFAAFVVNGLIANKGLSINAELLASVAYKIADALMEEKEECDDTTSD